MTDSDCGSFSACMITCCASYKCLDLAFLCPNPGAPKRLFAMGVEGSQNSGTPRVLTTNFSPEWTSDKLADGVHG
jgi:hypothetical protein